MRFLPTVGIVLPPFDRLKNAASSGRNQAVDAKTITAVGSGRRVMLNSRREVNLMNKATWIIPIVGCLLSSSLTLGQDFHPDELRSISEARYIDQRISELEARLKAFEDAEAKTSTTSLETPQALPPVPDLTYQDALQPDPYALCPTVCCPSDIWLRPTPGFYGDAEILLLKWYDTDGDDGTNTTSDASRFTLGFMNDHGRSIRARYFEFGVADDIGPGQLLIQHADLEYAGRFALNNNWLGEISLGGRWASLTTPNPRIFKDTYGPVFGIDLRSELRDWLSIYGSARQSFQFGREEQEDDLKTFGITELGLGLELSHATCVREWYFRTGVESLYYTSVRDDEEDYGLVGLTFKLGTRF